jgi:hypothetical protein
MRGSPASQLLHVFKVSEINKIGNSKHKAKAEARAALAVEGRSATSAAIAEKTALYNFGTAETYLDKWCECGRYCRDEMNLKNMELLSGDHVWEYLLDKIEEGVSYSTWQGNAAALSKLESALNLFSQKFVKGLVYSFRPAIDKLRPEAQSELPRFEGTRQYLAPDALTAALNNPAHHLGALLQHRGGVRVHEASLVLADQLHGVTRDEYTGRSIGTYQYQAKGGKLNKAKLPIEVYQLLEDHIKEHGQLSFSADVYRAELKFAAKKTRQKYNGSHGLRWNYARERLSELLANNISFEHALGIVSSELSHNRIAITRHYTG